jgi:riboflavin synthase
VLAVETRLDTASFALGESVAVDGVCLTVAAVAPGRFDADVSPETLRRATLGGLEVGAPVNLERALRPVDRLGGHFVLGHVDGTGVVRQRRPQGEFEEISFRAPPEVRRYLVEKGSVAVSGVSLTVFACDPEGFSVAVIPHTLERTTLAGCRGGDGVNLEADILGKYVEKLLSGGREAPGLNMETLARSGFLA